jgi:2-amino-4-hydroxy-6-hydroxymethyldihydropteridine diphosphokinase
MEEPGPDDVRASLADQAGPGLAIAIGANLPGPVGDPLATLLAVRPRLVALLQDWLAQAAGGAAGSPPASALRWSPLFRTAPVGGPPGQPHYLNAVLLLPAAGAPSADGARGLLQRLLALEQQFGRERGVRWAPRSLDLDLLWWGDLLSNDPALELPHPRWHQRAFVLAPLLALERAQGIPLALPLAPGAGPLVALAAACDEPLPEPLPPHPAWPE